jgi:tetratricopeptide (TPR) repeat protein
MSKKLNRIPVQAQQKKAQLPVTIINQMVALYNSGQWDSLVAMARDATKRHPQNAFGWKALSKSLLMSGKPSEALTALTQLAKLAPNDADTHTDLALAFHNLGRFDEEEKSYRRVLKIDPRSSLTYDKLGALYCELGRFEEAETEFRHALEIDPLFVQAHINLGFAVDTLGRWSEAETSYRRALEINPGFVETYKRLGDLIARFASRRAEAIIFLEKAIALNPGDANLFLSLGNILMAEKRFDECHAMFRRAQQIQPLITWPSKKQKADFSVLLLDAPEVGCTPVNYLVGRTMYDSHFLALLAGEEYDIDFLRSKADVVINMISDADNGKDVLPFALDIADRIGRPTVNHPRRIIGTDRETIASLLSGIALCRIPKTVRLSAEVLAGADWHQFIEGFTMPLLIRCAGTHGGDDFEKIDDIGAIAPFVSSHPDANFYVSEFADYRSADGYYRKYRLISLNDEILPYHLAIHDHWLVHHFRTDMANQEWMRKEEEAFLKDPHLVFSKEHYDALKEVAKAIGLDYCGIDCSLDRDGKIVVFEANATMRVHDEKVAIFTYKNPYIAKIKEAFDAMLARLAASR